VDARKEGFNGRRFGAILLAVRVYHDSGEDVDGFFRYNAAATTVAYPVHWTNSLPS